MQREFIVRQKTERFRLYFGDGSHAFAERRDIELDEIFHIHRQQGAVEVKKKVLVQRISPNILYLHFNYNTEKYSFQYLLRRFNNCHKMNARKNRKGTLGSVPFRI